LAIAERPFDECCAKIRLIRAHWLQTVLRRNPLMTLVVMANAVLKQIVPRRQRCGDPVDIAKLGRCLEPALQPNRLSDGKKMLCSVAWDCMAALNAG
jgi:hypothetical protein